MAFHAVSIDHIVWLGSLNIGGITMPTTIRQTCRIKKETLSLTDLNTFAVLADRRNMRANHINKIYRALCDGHPISDAISVNLLSGQKRIIDGNHRFEALKKYFNEHPDEKIEIWIQEYDSLSAQEEKEKFTELNTVISQTTDDFIKMYATNIPILQMMQGNNVTFPTAVRIYNLKQGQEGVHFAALIRAYLTWKKSVPPSLTIYSGGRYQFVSDAQALDGQDYRRMVNFINFFQSVFGTMSRQNEYQTTNLLNTLATIYLDNSSVPLNKLSNTMKRKVLNNTAAIQMGRMGGIVGTINCYSLIGTQLRSSRNGNLFSIRNCQSIAKSCNTA
jgi:hypothetical protein